MMGFEPGNFQLPALSLMLPMPTESCATLTVMDWTKNEN